MRSGCKAASGAAPCRGSKVRTGQMRQRRRGEIAIDKLEARVRLAQAVHDGGGNLAVNGVGAEDAGVDVQKFHYWITLGIDL